MKLNYKEAAEVAAIIRTPFGFPDNKGRETGYVCTIQPVDVTEGGDGYWCPKSITDPGAWFRVHGSPTRAGLGFGPAFNYSFWPTRAAAWNESTRLAEQCRKSYLKKFSPAK